MQKTLEVMKIKKFWNWIKNDDERTLFLNGVISDETWYGDEITPKLFKDELNSESGDTAAFGKALRPLIGWPDLSPIFPIRGNSWSGITDTIPTSHGECAKKLMLILKRRRRLIPILRKRNCAGTGLV